MLAVGGVAMLEGREEGGAEVRNAAEGVVMGQGERGATGKGAGWTEVGDPAGLETVAWTRAVAVGP